MNERGPWWKALLVGALAIAIGALAGWWSSRGRREPSAVAGEVVKPEPARPSERQERDTLPFAKILAVGLIAIAFGAAAVWWSSRMDQPRAPQVAQAERIPTNQRDAVEDSLLSASTAAADLRRRQEEELAGWAWVDREHGIASVPIDVAIDAWLARQPADGAAR